MQLSSHRRCSLRKGVLKNFAQVFSCEFCKISKNTLFTEQVWTTASYNRVMGCSTKGASCCRFRKAVLNNFLLINFITTYAYWLKNFSFANFLLIEGYRKHYLRKGRSSLPSQSGLKQQLCERLTDEFYQYLQQFRSSLPEVFGEKVVLINVADFAEKHMCQSLFFNKVAGLRLKLLFY